MSLLGQLKAAGRRRLLRLGWELGRFPSAQTHVGLLHEILRIYEVDAVIDVGANTGYFGTLIRTLGYRGPVVSFEPVAEAFGAVSAQARRRPPWVTYDFALGRAREVRVLNVAGQTEISSFLHPTRAYFDLLPAEQTSTEQRSVRIETLDAVAPQEPLVRDAQRIFLKTDTQGFDMEVLAGAEETLKRVVALQTELAVTHIYESAPDWVPTIESIQTLGFVLAGLFPIANDGRLRLLELDAVFVRPEQT